MTPEQEGDYLAFARERSPHLFRSALMLTSGSRSLAEDLTQETLGRMYQVWSKVEFLGTPASYAHSVLVRAFLSHRRLKSSAEQPLAEMPDAAAEEPDTAQRVALMNALRTLSAADRAVLVMRFYADLSVDEVALELRRRPGAIRSQTQRALGRLRAALGSDLFEFI